MTTPETIRLEDAYQIPTYNKMPVALERGEGCYVWDVEGRKYLDFYGGHCVALLGHCPPPVVEAVQEQAARLVFYSNAAHSPVRARAAERLVQMAPASMAQTFFCNSGSEANETALKLARTFTGKSSVVAMEGGFHGRTLGALATTHAEKYRRPYADVLPDTHFVPFGDTAAVADVLGETNDDVAAVLLEPIQSIAGVREAAPTYLRELRALCDAHGAALIFDEVQTGVGRTGTFSISEALGARPDLITMAKSLGAGMPVSTVLVSEEIAATVEPGDQGSTFGGGMMAMAALDATLRTIEENDLMARAAPLFSRLEAALAPRDAVRDVRGRGCLIGVELHQPAAPLRAALREEGVLVGGANSPRVLRLMPPLTTPDVAVDTFADAFDRALAKTKQKA
ncbi:MAG: aspartate aminotransferase family protein [Bacteroidetes bacterium QS_8_68_28]|nr:MAG: aspartate aminotransferase family protein [Bacteroidetes bacterium QS_8_68_28]